MSARGTRPAVLVVALFAAMLLAAGTSEAGRGDDKGRESGWRDKGGQRARPSAVEGRQKGGGERVQRGDRARSGGEVRYKGNSGQARGSDRAYRGGDARYKGNSGQARGGDRANRGSDARYKGNSGQARGGDRANRGGDARYKGDGGRIRGGGSDWRAPRDRGYVESRRGRGSSTYYNRGGSSYPYYGGVRYSTAIAYRYPRTCYFVGFGIGLPYYCPTTYRHHVVRQTIVRYAYEIQVENLPPAGCYYYDPFCGQEFQDLDSYTDHIDHEGHEYTIEILYRDSGDFVRTLEFAGGFWVVQR